MAKEFSFSNMPEYHPQIIPEWLEYYLRDNGPGTYLISHDRTVCNAYPGDINKWYLIIGSVTFRGGDIDILNNTTRILPMDSQCNICKSPYAIERYDIHTSEIPQDTLNNDIYTVTSRKIPERNN